jgi:hypothetical protein
VSSSDVALDEVLENGQMKALVRERISAFRKDAAEDFYGMPPHECAMHVWWEVSCIAYALGLLTPPGPSSEGLEFFALTLELQKVAKEVSARAAEVDAARSAGGAEEATGAGAYRT